MDFNESDIDVGLSGNSKRDMELVDTLERLCKEFSENSYFNLIAEELRTKQRHICKLSMALLNQVSKKDMDQMEKLLTDALQDTLKEGPNENSAHTHKKDDQKYRKRLEAYKEILATLKSQFILDVLGTRWLETNEKKHNMIETKITETFALMRTVYKHLATHLSDMELKNLIINTIAGNIAQNDELVSNIQKALNRDIRTKIMKNTPSVVPLNFSNLKETNMKVPLYQK